MRLLILSFYYPPDLSAGSFRCSALIDALQRAAPGLEIDLLTTQPNRYRQSSVAAEALQHRGTLKIHRFHLPNHDSGMVDQVKAFASYARQAIGALRADRRYDAVFATSSRLMTACLGGEIARRLKVPLYLDIRDLFADTLDDILAGWKAKLIGPCIRILERRTFRSARRINIVSEGFADYIRRVTPTAQLQTFTNGIDEEFLATPLLPRSQKPGELPLIVYAGNVGEGQGLHRIIPPAAKRLAGRVRFRVIGHGGRFQQLQAELDAHNAKVECLPPIPRAELHRHYEEADILFLHLNDYQAFRKVLPSKIFEYAATGRPIVAGVSGYSAQFIGKHVRGAEVFSPCDVDGFVRAIELLQDMEIPIDRRDFLRCYRRATIMSDMANDILQFMQIEN